MSDSTVIWAMWVPVVVFSHAFALFWLAKTYMLNVGAAGLFGKRKSTDSKDVAASDGAVSDGATSQLIKPGSDITVALSPAAPAIEGTQPSDVVKKLDQDAQTAGKVETPFAGLPTQDQVVVQMRRDASSSDLFQEGEPTSRLASAMSLRVEQNCLEWQGVGCSYNLPGGTLKVVLNDVWGHAEPGKMQALLGPSGAGKSTLMDILAQRKSIGNLTGRLLVSGQAADKSFIRQTSYVPQDDNFVPTMTTAETLSFYSSIVMPSSWGAVRRRERVTEVLSAVGLAHAQRTLVGGSLPGGLLLRGLSGGERKRLSIAAGILAAPSVVFLDEPTSGLDSFAALTVMGYLRRMARDNGHVIIASIHQPRSAIWMMFDTVTLLANGRLMYHGSREGMLPWFASQGYVHDPALHGVPSDWALDLVAVGFSKPRQFYGRTMTNVDDLAAASKAFLTQYAKAAPCAGGAGAGGERGGHAATGRALLAGCFGSQQAGAAGEGAGRSHGPKYASGVWTQFTSLLWRELLSITRNPADVAGRTLTFVWVGILLGLLYWGQPDGFAAVRNKLDILFNIQVFFLLMPYISMSLYASDKKFYLADATAKLYRPLVYYIAKVIATTPFQILSALVFTLTVYGMAGLRHGADGDFAPAKNAFTSVMVYLIAVQVLHCCALLAPNQDIAFMLNIVWTAIQMLLSGFFIVFDEVYMYWLTYLRYMSALYYSFEGAATAEFRGAVFNCSGGLEPGQMSLLRSAFTSPSLERGLNLMQAQQASSTCTFHCDAVLDYFGFTRSFPETAGILVGYLLASHVLTYVVMVVVARRERR